MSLPPVEPLKPLLKSSTMVMRELDTWKTESLRDQLFAVESELWKDKGGSPFYHWYKRVATGETAVRADIGDDRIAQGRLIAWNVKKPFEAVNINYRSLDTCRLLPVNCADFRLQLYTMEEVWKRLESAAETRGDVSFKTWLDITLILMMYEILLLRNFHDFGGADVPIIIAQWSSEQMDIACNYWVELSKGNWSEEETSQKFDLVYRALLQDPEVGYVPPFVILYSANSKCRARAIFTEPENRPPGSLTRDFPSSCNSPNCTETSGCGSFDLDKCVSLAPGSPLVRKSVWTKSVRCNYWPCKVQEPRLKPGETVSTEKSKFLRCTKCRDVLYCSRLCQKVDWNHHKLVCEPIPTMSK
ncbi:hypothetical protein FA15DRAFT_687417 [Coprinopsis marcescibilis]|uniref:MYND-type domain-containing protein n=1 Tax=Coprinopsis marcescibilis TaxID=230819 RepID=A0A5C3KWF0_COPMA|nr:hypothetical protein FA15DRAFT_687417 [Coprinopsis marcescibilis]